jgi:septal ring factor EnvC (AmiA/AmiB activator)
MRRLLPIRGRLAALAAGALLPLALWFGLPLASHASRLDRAQSQLDQARSRESSLSSAVAQLSRLIDQLDGDIALLARREAQVQSELDRARAALARTQDALRRERARLARLKARLAFSRQVLARRLVQMYEGGRPDMITVIFEAKGFADLLERSEFLRRINRQDRQIITAVRRARDATHRVTVRLAGLEARQQRIETGIEAQRNALASMEQALAAKRASVARARAARMAALRSARGSRQRLEQVVSKLEAEQQGSGSTFGPGGPWAIPWAIVQCESGGQNLPPNWAGASGYYQIIPSTWSGFGGSGPAAYLASKAEQDRVASRIWDGGRGAGNWDCARIIHFGGL